VSKAPWVCGWLSLLQGNASLAGQIHNALRCGVTEIQPRFSGAQVLHLAQTLQIDALTAAHLLGVRLLTELKAIQESAGAIPREKQNYTAALRYMRSIVWDSTNFETAHAFSNPAPPDSTELIDPENLARINPGWQSNRFRLMNCRECVLAFDQWARTGRFIQAAMSTTGDASMLPIVRT
jgi:hypothetical protein